MKLITILLATYNGEKYLEDQLQSLLNQTYSDWQLVIRDDNSSDNTPAILERYQREHPDKITIIPNNGINLGSVLNFNALLTFAQDAEYIMLCDQDDKWMPDKIEDTLTAMLQLEAQHSSAQPLMIFTDFLYVDEQLQMIPSKKDFHIAQLFPVRFAHLLAQNHIYGCTMMINKALTRMVLPIPKEAENHDHWIALVASVFGSIQYVNKQTILYRQHNRNISGSHDNSSFKKRFRRIFMEGKNFKDAGARYTMMQVFRNRYYTIMDNKHQQTLDDFLAFYTNKSPMQVWKNIKNGMRSQTMHQSLLFYITVFLKKKPA